MTIHCRALTVAADITVGVWCVSVLTCLYILPLFVLPRPIGVHLREPLSLASPLHSPHHPFCPLPTCLARYIPPPYRDPTAHSTLASLPKCPYGWQSV